MKKRKKSIDLPENLEMVRGLKLSGEKGEERFNHLCEATVGSDQRK